MSFYGKILIISSVVIMAFALPIQFFSSRPASADEYDEKIAAIQNKVQEYQNRANDLRSQSDTLKNTIAELNADKSAIQAQLALTQAQHDKLTKEITDTETRIAENKRVSGDLIVKSSASSDIPLIARLAASDNLADYIEGEATRISVRDTIVKKTEETEKLKKQLVAKKEEVKKVLAEQTLRRDELASKEATQQSLLAKTNGDEAAYQNLIGNSQSEIAKLEQEREQRRLAAQSWSGGYITTGGSGGYPWSGVGYPCWSMSCVDPWGLFYRECVSYVAWKLSAAGKGVRGFGGAGHAYQWPSTTSGYTSQSRGTNPKAGDAVVIPAGVQGIPWTGHIMYVESVNGDGSINISEYNFDGNGSYSERRISPAQYGSYVFITFPSR